jgi:hypothetical protein
VVPVRLVAGYGGLADSPPYFREDVFMSTKATIAYHGSDENLPSWHLYEEVFEPGVVYLTLQGVAAELG